MTTIKSLDEKIKDKEVFDLAGAALASGYTEQHLRRLCKARKVSHLRRGRFYFFTPSDVENLFKPAPAVPTSAKAVKAENA